jgi:GT2 family glycosyltransferase
VAINSEWMQKLGGFDERFFLYWADADLSARLHEKSLRIVIQRSVSVVHTGADPLRPLPGHLGRIMRKDLVRFVDKHRPGLTSAAVNIHAKVLAAVNKDAI